MSSLLRERCNWIDPLIVAKKLVQHYGEPGLVWLDSDGSKNGRWVILGADPIEHICSHGLPSSSRSQNPFELLRKIDSGHWSGWLSYEAGAWIEPNNPWKQDSMAMLWMARHDPIFKFDLYRNELWIEGVDHTRFLTFLNLLKDISSNESLTNATKSQSIPEQNWEWTMDESEYSKKVAILKNYIKEGDIFQANLSTSCITKIPLNLSVIDLFQKLRNYCPAPFSGLVVATGNAIGEAVISTSPERFLKVLPNKVVETSPIKGTRPRSSSPQKDADLAADLVSSIKDRAENIMIVDLLRNDIGKVCKPGTIKVTQLVGLESYAQVHHLTSIIQGKLNHNKTWVDLLESCWPGGSITGAPKIRACKRLYEMEPIARGPYCGSFLHLDWNGQFDSNILIRSLLKDQSNLRVHAGCGIVADSDPSNEAEELNWKLKPLIKALEQ
ncbi:anthranilate synthase component I family protein [Prochlorococcus marinus]|uniref:anthranilate synthase component I family protein n=1 Tax=Prochlorococcus marinus TaxID=1219 RepID=UPI0022B3A1D3|nr:anthranilate synthase component I family protein [Prochlorococcus marinus]